MSSWHAPGQTAGAPVGTPSKAAEYATGAAAVNGEFFAKAAKNSFISKRYKCGIMVGLLI
jgi:hypothetical protein